MARVSMATPEMIAAFGKTTRVPTGRRTMTERQFKYAVRGEPIPTEEPIKRTKGTLHLRCGHGSK